MKKSVLSLIALSMFVFGCTTNVTTSPNSSSSASPASSSVPSGSSTPQASQVPGASATPVASAKPSPSPTAASSTSTQKCTDASKLTVGQKMTGTDFFGLVCLSSVKVGTKWVYTVLSSEVSVEIISKNVDDTYTVRTKVTGQPDKDIKTTHPTGSSESTDSIEVTYLGTESVTVPAGTYNAYKGTVTQTNNGVQTTLTYWLDKSTGAVKVTSDTSVSGFNVSTVSNLKEFKN